ncbi:MAG: hypothetical protein FJZ12_02010 [Candidatus Omnitrophica bacterium]|nr:hypothetical protein [Candidatus Omnitrophota bacterium]
MDQQTLILDSISLEDLDKELTEMVKIEGGFIILNISNPKLIVRQVEMPSLFAREMESALKLEAAELLSLTQSEVALEYKILDSQPDKTNVVFIALPKQELKKYYSGLVKVKAIPLSITAKILSSIDVFLKENTPEGKSFLLLDFSGKDKVYLALFNSGVCEHLREIDYENIQEAQTEISQSIRYALSKSANKDTHELFFTGSTEDKADLIAKLETEFSIKGKVIKLAPEVSDASVTSGYFGLNLIKKYSASIAERKKIHKGLNVAIGVFAFIFIFGLINFIKVGSQIRSLKKDYDPSKRISEYSQKIKDIQQKIKVLQNEK